jgi:hypothetical protein
MVNESRLRIAPAHLERVTQCILLIGKIDRAYSIEPAVNYGKRSMEPRLPMSYRGRRHLLGTFYLGLIY